MLSDGKIRITRHVLILSILILISFIVRIWDIDKPGYNIDEPLIITGGIKYYLPSDYNPSLYDNALPGAKLWMGLFINLFSGRDLSPLADYGIRAFGMTTLNSELLKGLEFYARFPGAIFGLIAGIFVYLLVRDIYGKNAGLVGFVLFSFNPLLITYSRLALGEIYQISYMIISVYLFYKSFMKKNPYMFIASAVFLGLCIGTKLNGLIVLPFFIIAIILRNIKVKKSIEINYNTILTKSGVLIFFSLLTLWAVVGFDLGTISTIVNYYNTEGYNGLGFYLFEILKELFFYTNPLIWVLFALSVYKIIKNKEYLDFKGQFVIVLLLLFICSTFLKTQSTIKREIQFSLFIFIVSCGIFEKIKNKSVYIIPAIVLIADLGLVLYYFPTTGFATGITCMSEECIKENAIFYFDSRAVGEKLNELPEGLIFETTLIEGHTKFYLNNPEYYLSSGLLSWIYEINDPSFETLKYNNITYVIKHPYYIKGFEILELDSKGCKYYSIYKRNVEMSRIYDLSTC